MTPGELKNVPCILVSSRGQRETERGYYHDVVGFRGEFLFAETLEEARLMVIGGQGFMPAEGAGVQEKPGELVSRVPLFRGEEPVRRNYCGFWKKDNSGYYVEEFADMLKRQFEGET